MLKPARKKDARIRLAIAGPAGSGKTYSSLLIASGLAPWEKIVIIDTERGSSNCYADLGPFNVIELEPAYTPAKYIAAIKEAENAGMEVIIIDSLSHAWAGEGGVLDIHSQAVEKNKNSFSAWREVTPLHNRLVDTMLQSRCHVIATLRTKTEYVIDEGGKKVRKVGLAPIQRDGLEYEFTIFGDLSPTHLLTVSKDRTGLFQDQSFQPDPEMGRKIKTWLVDKPEQKSEQKPEQQEPVPVAEIDEKPVPQEEKTVIIVEPPQEGYAPAVILDTDQEIVLNLSGIEIPDLIPGTICKVTGVEDGMELKVSSLSVVSDETAVETTVELYSKPVQVTVELDGETVQAFAAKALTDEGQVTVMGEALKDFQKGQILAVAVTRKAIIKGKETWVIAAAEAVQKAS